MERIKIPEVLKRDIRERQDNRCAVCLETGKHFHHLTPVALGGKNTYTNIVFLCEKHHKLIHLVDLETILMVLEYQFYLNFKRLPNDMEEIRNFLEENNGNKTGV